MVWWVVGIQLLLIKLILSYDIRIRKLITYSSRINFSLMMDVKNKVFWKIKNLKFSSDSIFQLNINIFLKFYLRSQHFSILKYSIY